MNFANFPRRVHLTDVGPRDGLQNEKQFVPTAVKVELIHRLQAAGLKEIETTSFVSPKWVPQMADNAEVMAGIIRRSDVRYAVLVPNMQGFEAALQTRPHEVVVFGAASEAFSQKNINCSRAQSMARFEPVVRAALDAGLGVRGAISVAVGCPYEGAIPASNVETMCQMMKDIGVPRVAVCDTIGVGTPNQVQAAMQAALKHYALDCVAGHFHDTYGLALANTLAALEMGIHHFDAAVGGLGGCPYAKGATGNVATEDVVFMLNGMGIETGVDLDCLVDAAQFISQALGRTLSSRVGRAILNKRAS